MNLKKGIVLVVVSLALIWVMLGLMARRGIETLLDKNNNRQQDGCVSNESLVFGICLEVGAKISPGSVTWLTDDENTEFRKLIKTGNLGRCASSDTYFMDGGSLDGAFYIVPRWVHALHLKTILYPLMHRVEMFYWPHKRFLYLSEDIESLGYDLSKGINIFNVSPECLHLHLWEGEGQTPVVE